jgi:hypothetical protein
VGTVVSSSEIIFKTYNGKGLLWLYNKEFIELMKQTNYNFIGIKSFCRETIQTFSLPSLWPTLPPFLLASETKPLNTAHY